MATSDKVTSVDALSKDERAIVVSALILMGSSLSRAIKSERDEVVKERRIQSLAQIDVLKARFS